MHIKVRKSLRPTYINFLMLLISIMPFVDSVSGALHDIYPIGQIYRIIFFTYMLLIFAKYSKRKLVQIGIFFFAFMIVQIFIAVNSIKCIQDIIKLFTPIILISLFGILLRKQKIEISSVFKIIERWAVYYPMLILIPGIIGIGKNAYEDTTGWKGFFYATNEISFIMSCLIMFLVWELSKKISLKTIILLGLNILTIILLGTKTGYATVGVFVVIYFIKSFQELKRASVLKNIFIVLLSCIAAITLYNIFFDEIHIIFERWMYQKDVFSYSLIDFLTSHRLRRFRAAWISFVRGKLWYILFGCGFGAEFGGFENMEMDWIDLFFRVGVAGFLFVLTFYSRCFINISKHNFWGFAIMLWMFFLSFGAGHVLFYGQSGMMFGIMIVVCYLIRAENSQKEIILLSKNTNTFCVKKE